MEMDNNDLERLINNWLKPISDKLDYVTQSQQKDIDRHREDLDDLYTKDRETKERLTETETTVKTHLDNHKDIKDSKQFNIGQWVVIGLCILTILSDKISF